MKKTRIILHTIIVLLLMFSNLSFSATFDGIYSTERSSKPSYQYLKSVTVIVEGQGYEIKRGRDDNNKRVEILRQLHSWIGTGIIVDIVGEYTYVLTNRHVALGENYEEISLTVSGDFDNKLKAELIDSHDSVDLALIKVTGRLYNKSKIKGLAIGTYQDEVYVVGHHLGREYIYGEGVFAGYDENHLLIQVPCAPGNSGSGIFNKEGKVIGLVFAINLLNWFDSDITHALCVRGEDIKKFLFKNGIYY